MIQKVLKNKLITILIFIAIGILATNSSFAKLFASVALLLPLFIIYLTKNNNEEAFILAAFLTGGEVFMRMSKGFFFYESGKYLVMIYLLFGLIIGKSKNKISLQFVVYFMLLIIGILFTNVPQGESIRKNILFNLSGPICLGISALYFFQRPISLNKVYDALFFALLPIFSTVSFLYYRTPDVREIVFGGDANFEASGGFGPNQVATAIGLGIFIISVLLISKIKISGFLVLDYVFLTYFIYRGVLTFSRGGLITGFIALAVFAIFYLIYNKISFRVVSKYLFFITVFAFSLWLYTSNVTGGMIENRYTGKNASGKKKDITSGRGEIINIQFDNFLDNPLGIGVGNGKYDRILQQNNVTAASHNEVGRLLEEHGYLGFLILLILLTVPLFNFLRSNNLHRALLIAFYVIWFLTINHSAMRIALPGFIYALSLIHITDEEYA